ncbi:hypothetical protein ACFL1I_01075 [Candidatus Omnitrophota bacterium]
MKQIVLLLISLLVTTGFIFAQGQGAFIYDDKGRRDPFFALVDQHGRYRSGQEVSYYSENLNLSGILWDPRGASSAVINGEVVKLGDPVAGFVLKEVTENSITVSKDGQEYVIRLSLDALKQEE